MMPEAVHFAGSFIQAQLTGKGEAGSHAYDQVSDWKRWVCSRTVKYFSASEGDRPPSSCNTDCKASATAAGICLAFLEERAGDVMHPHSLCSNEAASPCSWPHCPFTSLAIRADTELGWWEPASPCNAGSLA